MCATIGATLTLFSLENGSNVVNFHQGREDKWGRAEAWGASHRTTGGTRLTTCAKDQPGQLPIRKGEISHKSENRGRAQYGENRGRAQYSQGSI